MQDISCQQLTGKLNSIHITIYRVYVHIFRKHIQDNRYIFNQIRHVQSIGNKLIGIPTKYTTSENIGDVFSSHLTSDLYYSLFVKIPFRYDWCDSIFADNDKMVKSTTLSAPFIRS